MRRHQALALQALGDIIFGLPAPRTLRLKGRVVVGRFRLIIYGGRPLHEDLTQLLLFPNTAKVVAPQARLCPEGSESQALCLWVSHAALFAVDEGRKPLVLSRIHPPAIEIEVVADQRRPVVRAVETHDVEILILHPDAADEASFACLRQWIDVKYQTTHFAQKLASDILNLVMLAVEPVHIHVDHLQEAARDKFRVEKDGPPTENLVLHAAGVMLQRFEFHALRQLGPPKKVFVAVRYRSQLLIGADILDVGFHERRILAKQLHLRLLLPHDLVHHFAQNRRQEQAEVQLLRQYSPLVE